MLATSQLLAGGIPHPRRCLLPLGSSRRFIVSNMLSETHVSRMDCYVGALPTDSQGWRSSGTMAWTFDYKVHSHDSI